MRSAIHFIVFFVAIFEIRLLAAAEHSHSVPTYFWKLDANGKLIDRSLPEYDDEIRGKTFINTISREDALSVKLEAWPEVVKNGDKITVLWQDVAKPQSKDFIGYYCPYYDDVNHYLDYIWTSSSMSWEKGYGHHELTVYNMRSTCGFRYYRASGKFYILAAVSNRVNFAEGGPAAPLQGHIALANEPTEMRIMWVSGEAKTPPVVRYGTTKDLELKENAHITHTYTKDALCQSPGNANGFWHPGYVYDILLTNLLPNTLYYYAFGTEEYLSEVSNFTTPIPRGDQTPFKFIVYGDMGIQPYPQAVTTATNVRKEVDDNKIRYVFHHGDISYARGYAYIWEQWFAMIEPYASLVPYMVGIGNHEYDHTKGGEKDPSGAEGEGGFRPSWWNGGTDSGGECGVPMTKRFHMPDNGNSVFWYSYDYGMVHMIMMSTEHDFSPGSEQYLWLENDLRNVDRKATPWVMIGGHRAMYCSEKIESDFVVAGHMQELFEDLLYKYKVDIAFWAHYHSYERTCKLYKNKCVEDGVVHIVVGSAGKSRDTDEWYDKPWSLFRRSQYGYGRVTVANASALLYEWVENLHYKVVDHVWLTK